MANYRQIHVNIWKDPWFLELQPDEKLLFIYLFSNESSSIAGIYELSLRVVAFETCLPMDFVSLTIEKFSKEKKVFRDGNVIWVVNLRKHHETSSIKIKTRIDNDVSRIPGCELKKKYLAYYSPKIPYPYPIDTPPLKEEEEDILKEEEEEKGISPSTTFTYIDAERVIREITQMVSVPPGERVRLEQVLSFLNVYGYEQTKDFLNAAYQAWINTKGKNGRTYRPTNLAWIDWAQDNALLGDKAYKKSLQEMSNEEKIAHILSEEFTDA